MTEASDQSCGEKNKEAETWKLGIKLRFLVEWSQQQGITATQTTREICEDLVKPATQDLQVSYCELLLRSESTAEFVGPPSAFISHAWSYNFLEVLEALTSYFAAEEDVVIWFDVFSHNQHILASLDAEWWCSTFKNAITSFGRTVMVLAPWNNPLPLQRGWCIWELYCTIEGKRSGKCEFDVAMSPASIDQFIADVDADPGHVIDTMLATIDTSKSECFKAEDRERIHDAIRRTVGFNELNKEILEIMRGWVISNYENRCKALKDQRNPQLLASIANLAYLYSNQGDYGKALPLFEECFRIWNAELGENHPATLQAMNNLACLYKNQGEYEKALPLYEKCLRLQKLVLRENDPSILISMNNLAGLYNNQGKYEKALPLYEDCLKMSRIVFGDNHTDTLILMNNLAGLYVDQGEYEKALRLYEECLRISRIVLGENHPSTLSLKNNLGLLYNNQGEYEKALLLYDLKTMVVVWGENHPDTLTCMSNIGTLYEEQGEYGKALPLFEKCFRLRKVLLGENHPDTLTSMLCLAILQNNQGEYGKALPLFEECWSLRKVVLGENHPDTLYCLNNLAIFHNNQGDYRKAMLLHEECWNLRKALLGENHPDTLESRKHLTPLYDWMRMILLLYLLNNQRE